jgi:glucan 1,3-beta-glucosidase
VVVFTRKFATAVIDVRFANMVDSFFENYSQTCLDSRDCQENMISVEKSTLNMYAITTIATTNQVTLDGQTAVNQADNVDVYGSAFASFTS